MVMSLNTCGGLSLVNGIVVATEWNTVVASHKDNNNWRGKRCSMSNLSSQISCQLDFSCTTEKFFLVAQLYF